MINPFVDTMLYTTVVLHPSQLNNNIYMNIKQNLVKTLEKKCYKKYGFINKVYEIIERGEGTILPEDPTSSVAFKIKFSCNLCHPLEQTQIICRVVSANDVLISLNREPIMMFVSQSKFNNDVFYLDPMIKKLRIKKTGDILNPNDFVKATILTKTINDKDRKIIAMCQLDDIATEEEIQTFYDSEYNRSKQIIEYDEYISQDNKPKKMDNSESTKINSSDDNKILSSRNPKRK